MIAGLLLAAGASRRFGATAAATSKLLQDLNGKSVLRWSLGALASPAIGDLYIVVPPDHTAIDDELADATVHRVVNEHTELGMGSSIAVGVGALPERVEAVIIALADEPLHDPGAIDRVIGRYRQGGVRVVITTYLGEQGHPVLFDRVVFPELAKLTGDRGAREVIMRHRSTLGAVEMNVPRPTDVDTPEDLARLRRLAQNTSSRTQR